MSTIRKHYDKWQSIVRVLDHPVIYKSFKTKIGVNCWATLIEVKFRREYAVIIKVKFPKFKDVARCYIEELSIHKKCY